jgi:uncharacterized integral membrane protein (TIGR00698 family)
MSVISRSKNRVQAFNQGFQEVWPGLILVLGVALVSRFLHGLLAGTLLARSISEILIAMLIGLVVRNVIGYPQKLTPGITFSIKKILRFGIILLGLRLSLQDIAATGWQGLGLIGICITLTLSLAWGAKRWFQISPRLATLIGVGTAICGNSAIIATAPVIEANDEEVSFAVATITLFGLLAVLIYPFIGRLLNLPDALFGLWAGTAVNDTSQVVAVGAMYSDFAQNVATIIKLTRNVLMAPLIFAIGLVYQRSKGQKTRVKGSGHQRVGFGKLVPGFVLGFVLMAVVRTIGVTLGIFPQDVAAPGHLEMAARSLIFLDSVSKFAILMALSAVGLNTSLASLKRIGLKPLVVGTLLALTLSVTSLVLILFTPLGG